MDDDETDTDNADIDNAEEEADEEAADEWVDEDEDEEAAADGPVRKATSGTSGALDARPAKKSGKPTEGESSNRIKQRTRQAGGVQVSQ